MTFYFGSAVTDQKKSGQTKPGDFDNGRKQQKERYLNHGRVSGLNHELLYRSSTIDALKEPEDDWTPSTFCFNRDGSGKRPKDLAPSERDIYNYMDAEDLKNYERRIQLIPITQTRRGQSLGTYVLGGVTSLTSTSLPITPESARLEWSLATQTEKAGFSSSSSIGLEKKQGADGCTVSTDYSFLFGNLRAEADKRGADSGATLAIIGTTSTTLSTANNNSATSRSLNPLADSSRKPPSFDNKEEKEESVLPTFKKTKKRRVNMKLAVSAATTDYYEDEAGPALLPKKNDSKQKSKRPIVRPRIKPAENAEGSKILIPQFVKVKNPTQENPRGADPNPEQLVYGCFVRDESSSSSSFRGNNVSSLSLPNSYSYTPRYLAAVDTVPPRVPAGGSAGKREGKDDCEQSNVSNDNNAVTASKTDGGEKETEKEDEEAETKTKKASRWDVKPPSFNYGPGPQDKMLHPNVVATVPKVNADKLSSRQEKKLQSSSLQLHNHHTQQQLLQQPEPKQIPPLQSASKPQQQHQTNLMHHLRQPRPAVPRISMVGATSALQNSLNVQNVTAIIAGKTDGTGYGAGGIAQKNTNKSEEDNDEEDNREYRYQMFLKHNAGLAEYYADPRINAMLAGWPETKIAAELNRFAQQALAQSDPSFASISHSSSSSSSAKDQAPRAIVFTSAAPKTKREHDEDQDSSLSIAPEQTTRKVTPWTPEPLLCKRFGVAVPHADRSSSPSSGAAQQSAHRARASSRASRNSRSHSSNKEEEQNKSKSRLSPSEMLSSQPPENKCGTLNAAGTTIIDLYHNARLSAPRAARWLYAAIFNPLSL